MGNLYNCIWPAVVSLAFGATLSSCILEDIEACSDRLPFTVENDWRSCPDAAPGGMAYIFFPDDGSEPWRFDFAGRDAGEVKMAPGSYRFLSYNDDTAHVLFREDGGYDSYKAYTRETDLLGLIPPVDRGESLPRIADERIFECPDMMWGCARCGRFVDKSQIAQRYDDLCHHRHRGSRGTHAAAHRLHAWQS